MKLFVIFYFIKFLFYNKYLFIVIIQNFIFNMLYWIISFIKKIKIDFFIMKIFEWWDKPSLYFIFYIFEKFIALIDILYK